MATRKGRPIASVVAIVVLGGTLGWLGRDHIRFALAFERLGKYVQSGTSLALTADPTPRHPVRRGVSRDPSVT